MAKSWLDWIIARSASAPDRRAKPTELPALSPADYEPISGTVVWAKLSAILEAERLEKPVALLVVDFDELTPVIETLIGSSREDALLWLAPTICQAVRAQDIVAHLYGYRFAVLLRGAGQDLAETVAIRIRESVEDALLMADLRIPRQGVAIGGVTYDPSREMDKDLFSEAFDNLDSLDKSKDGRSIVIT